jgi:predicted metal-binding membrane protein
MSDAPLEAVLRRDRAVVIASAVATAGLAWAYIVWLAADMNMDTASLGGSMSVMGVTNESSPSVTASGAATMAMPQIRSWSATEFAFMFWMWAVMMIGMMLPSAAPMLLIHARVARHSVTQGKPIATTGWFAAGYILAWSVFSVGATIAQWALERALVLTPMMASASDIFGGSVLIAAGLYQWTPLKDRCLSHCQAPLHFIQHHGGFRKDASGSLRLGLKHGLYCVGCCWVLMALLFVGGVMNILWIAAIAIFVLLEKVIPVGRLIARTAGVGLIALGLWTLV